MTDEMEIEANRFAIELLMPHAWLKRDLSEIGSIDIENDQATINLLAKKYGVSEQLMTIRVGDILREMGER